MADYSKKLENATKKHVDKERKRLIIDFDEAVKEQQSEPIEVQFQGDSYYLPANAPAWLPIFINRHTDENGVVSDKHNLEMIERLLGSKFADKILDADNSVSFEIVNTAILQPVMEEWGLGFQDESGNEKTRS